MSARPSVRIGLIGAGRMGSTHLDALERAPDVEVAGVVEPAALARARVALRGHRVHETVEALLDAGGVDGLLIAAPSDLHLSLLHAVAPSRLPVLCEKPVGIHGADATA